MVIDNPHHGLHVMGEHWSADLSKSTELGRLVSLAKDHNDAPAVAEICRRIGEFAAGRRPLAGHPSESADAVFVAAVPPNPAVHDHLAVHLAAAVSSALGQGLDPELITRRNPTVRLRDTDPAHRRVTAALAGYEVTRPLEGATVVLVDDVILTGTTVTFISELLFAAGAGRVEVVVASRTRRRSD